MSELSPAAQAALDAFRTSYTGQGCLAAALRAVIEEVIIPKYQYADWKMADLIARELRGIADELEAQ